MEQEPGSSGKGVISSYARKILKGYSFKGILSSGSKATRAKLFSAAASNNNVKLVNGIWVSDYLSELEAFRKTAHDDQVDASSLAFNMLNAGYAVDSALPAPSGGGSRFTS